MLTLSIAIAIAAAALASAPLPAVTAAPPAEFGPLPFAAWAAPQMTYVRHQAEPKAELAGSLRRGDAVRVTGVVAAADGSPEWAQLDGLGAVLLSALRPLVDRPLEAKTRAAEAQFVYARVTVAQAREYAAPSLSAKRLRTQAARRLLAFVPDSKLQAQGWLWRAGGGYLRLADLELLTASSFAGVRDPQLPLAFVRRRTRLRVALAPKLAPPVYVQRYQTLQVLREQGDFIWIPGGVLPRSRVRVAYPTPRPKTIPAGAKWMHVDLAEQVVVAHLGDQAVLATLMSSGRSPRQTTKGVFRIYAKTAHSTMRGDGAKGYVAEEVPWVMHFFEGQAMHGAYWHDQFGIPKSHGCLNLAPADASWLFAWIPPDLPAGWHTRLLGKGETAGYLEIDSASPAQRRKRALPRSKPPGVQPRK